MIRLAILHFQPLELYPPVMNFIDYIDNKQTKIQIKVFSTHPPVNHEYFRSNTVQIYRKGRSQAGNNRIGRLLQYCRYYFSTSYRLFKYNPDTVMYFETLSFLPVYFYCFINNLRRKPTRVFCHYHEYTSNQEYKSGMVINRALHALEKKWYKKMEWISLTNADRMDLFKKDVSLGQLHNTFILPNYPPKTWLNISRTENQSLPVRFVYVGALGMDTMYIKEFAEWIENHEGKFSWDIFSQQDGTELIDFLNFKNARHIQFKSSINYKKLPEILNDYDIGVILYKGHIANYIYNVPNKLFEYMACGLDIWFPREMTTSHLYINDQKRPKVIAVDFKNLGSFAEHQALTRNNVPFESSSFFCENELDILWKEISKMEML